MGIRWRPGSERVEAGGLVPLCSLSHITQFTLYVGTVRDAMRSSPTFGHKKQFQQPEGRTTILGTPLPDWVCVALEQLHKVQMVDTERI